MHKAIVILLVSCIFLSSCSMFSFEKTSAQTVSKTLYVGGTGEGYYNSIWDAINASSDGDTIFVYSGIYDENPIIDKKISLIGENKDNTVIQGKCGWDVIEVTADEVKISGFTIKNIGGSSHSKKFRGIDIESSGNTITDNIIQLNAVYHTEYFSGWKTNLGSYAIYISSEDKKGTNFILDNFITTDNLDSGVGIWVESQSKNIISNNEISKNQYGILLDESDYNVITGNTFLKSEIAGIRSDLSSYNEIYDNTFSNKDFVSLNGLTGIVIFYGSNDIINDNFFDNVNLHLRSNNSIITDNTFISGGISIGGENLESWNTHTIENNLVDGRPAYYFKNDHTGTTVPLDAGQVILANCSNFIVENLNILNAPNGIEIGYTSNTVIKNNILTNNSESLYLYGSSNNIVDFNIVKNIDLQDCEYNVISNNTITNQNLSSSAFSGIDLFSSNNNYIYKNTIINTTGGLIIWLSSNNNNIIENTISKQDHGIHILGDNSNNIISKNDISFTYYGIKIEIDAKNNQIYDDNIFSDNKKDIYYYNSTPNFFEFNFSNNEEDDNQLKSITSEPGNQTPGFEFLLVLCTIILLLLSRKKSK